ncbi:MAG: hypothetical protein LAQ30_22950 [Acidobacteriia bacterium]|nr:hypothetical protein [Terriglobia bacterium]
MPTTATKRSANAQPPGTPKRPARLPAKGASKPRTAPRATQSAKGSPQTGKPSLRFYYSKDLRAKTLSILRDVERAEDSTRYRGTLADVVVELADSGMDYYFLRPLKLADVGFITEQSANLGMAGTTSVLGSVIRNIIGRMDQPQLLTICGYIRELMK